MKDAMARKKRSDSNFAERLEKLRKSKGFTQIQLAKAINSTQRAISYYENETDYPPAPVVAELANALNVSIEELMGIKPVKKKKEDSKDRRLWKKFQQIKSLPDRDQRAIFRMTNSLIRTKTA